VSFDAGACVSICVSLSAQSTLIFGLLNYRVDPRNALLT